MNYDDLAYCALKDDDVLDRFRRGEYVTKVTARRYWDVRYLGRDGEKEIFRILLPEVACKTPPEKRIRDYVQTMAFHYRYPITQGKPLSGICPLTETEPCGDYLVIFE